MGDLLFPMPLSWPDDPGTTLVAGAPEGVDAQMLAALAASGREVLHIARDDRRLYRLADLLGVFAPDQPVMIVPAWDCLPYDRVSPHQDIVAQRADALAQLADAPTAAGRIVLTTVSSALQRVPPREVFRGALFRARRGAVLDVDGLIQFLTANGYGRVGTVREPGEFAVRGGLVDLYPPSQEAPVRLDLFGDELDSLRLFDPVTQKSTSEIDQLSLRPVGELIPDDNRISRFRTAYRELFGGTMRDDPLYEAVSAGHRYAGVEHWLPLFYAQMESLFDYVPKALVTLDHQVEQSTQARVDLIEEYYATRKTLMNEDGAGNTAATYRPLPPSRLYLSQTNWQTALSTRTVGVFTPFEVPTRGDVAAVDAGGRSAWDFAESRALKDHSLFEAVVTRIKTAIADGEKVIIAAGSPGSCDRLGHLLQEHGLEEIALAKNWSAAMDKAGRLPALVSLPLERGFRIGQTIVLSEQDILGDKLVQRAKRRRRADAFLTDVSSIDVGELVVHVDFGLGRYDGLHTLEVGGAPHDCLRILYDGGDKLFVPVENMELLSRFGTQDSETSLDRLGGAGWQARKAKVKERVREIAAKLIGIAAARAIRNGEIMRPVQGMYDEFASSFPFEETEDQARAIHDVLNDLESGKPMDRLICGDVGFGKTEVAMRAAFTAVGAGSQVAVVVPTTLLARQHYQTFKTRFDGWPVRIAQLSRLTPAKEATRIRKELADGKVDIVVGTHALLGKSIRMDRLGLLIVDEEQHFGVQQKERLKDLRADIHVLTLTATPIPRTLQMSLSGVRDMSLITTPPVDRLAVRTFVLPYDPVMVREAIQREIYRGGQVFYVCPRIADLARITDQLDKLVPDVSYVIAHGQMPAKDLEAVMNRFYEGAAQILIATNIIESGIDIPTVNTILIHRADRFGLSQLYQLRGRVGRSKTRAYAYLTVPNDAAITPLAQRRLEVMQTLDTLGAGFSLASHDMDIRGAGNLVGEEQSGHVKEVGVELYQQMLEEAVAAARDSSDTDSDDADSWTPQITVGTPVLIPDRYVADLGERLALYRRISNLVDRAEIDSFAAEMADRFGPLPEEVINLLDIIALKRQCRAAGVSKVDAGPKGAVISFHNNAFANPAGLIKFIGEQAGVMKVRPDHKLVYRRSWDQPEQRVKGLAYLMKNLAQVATASGTNQA